MTEFLRRIVRSDGATERDCDHEIVKGSVYDARRPVGFFSPLLAVNASVAGLMITEHYTLITSMAADTSNTNYSSGTS